MFFKGLMDDRHAWATRRLGDKLKVEEKVKRLYGVPSTRGRGRAQEGPIRVSFTHLNSVTPIGMRMSGMQSRLR